MPKTCSIPGCRTTYKQGLMLLCYPKDPSRRLSWLQTVRDGGLEPTNSKFVCELHFGPEQWEKLRVDGKKKLKWSGVPNVLDPADVEAARELSIQDGAKRPRTKSRSDEKLPLTGLESEQKPTTHVLPNINRKALKLDAICMDISPPLLLSSATNPLATVVKPKTVAPIEQPPVSSPESSQTTCNNLNEPFRESSLPLSCPGHSIIVRLPKSRYQNSLMEDLEDVRSFLDNEERSYEERLINAVTELIKKNEILDKKLRGAEAVFAENCALQKKMINHQSILLENRALKEKLRKYEQKVVVQNVLLRKSSSDDDSIIKIQETPQGRVCRITLQDKEAFVALDDQL